MKKNGLFSPDTGRIDYGKMLKPEAGYQLDFAVAMTYSLDLDAVLEVPIALGSMDTLNSEEQRNPICILEAVHRSMDKIAIFCNAGSISVPEKEKRKQIHTLLSGSVYEIALGEKKYFHPKLWIIRYSDKQGNAYMRIIVLSRNLTFDRSFDVACAMDAGIGNKYYTRNDPLMAMLKFVERYATSEKKAWIRRMAAEMPMLKMPELLDRFDDVSFMPFGIPGYHHNHNEGVPELKQMRRLFVVSPFLSEGVIRDLTDWVSEKTLITRKSSLSQKIHDCFDETYTVRDEVMDDDLLQEGTANEQSRRDIHAKMYFGHDRNHLNHLYLGSLNATENAFYKNVEFLVGFHYKSSYTSYQAFKEELLPEKGGLFELADGPFDGDEAEAEDQDDFQDVVYAGLTAAVVPDEDDYQVVIHSGNLKKPAEISLYSSRSLFKSLEVNTAFEHIQLAYLSEFFIIRRGENSIILKIPTEGIPEEKRDAAICNAIIKDHKGFLQYVLFVLSDDYSSAQMDISEIGRSDLNAGEAKADSPAIYEHILRVCAEEPERLSAITSMMEKLNPEIVDDRFRRMIMTCEQALKKVKK